MEFDALLDNPYPNNQNNLTVTYGPNCLNIQEKRASLKLGELEIELSEKETDIVRQMIKIRQNSLDDALLDFSTSVIQDLDLNDLHRSIFLPENDESMTNIQVTSLQSYIALWERLSHEIKNMHTLAPDAHLYEGFEIEKKLTSHKVYTINKNMLIDTAIKYHTPNYPTSGKTYKENVIISSVSTTVKYIIKSGCTEIKLYNTTPTWFDPILETINSERYYGSFVSIGDRTYPLNPHSAEILFKNIDNRVTNDDNQLAKNTQIESMNRATIARNAALERHIKQFGL